MSGTVWSQRHSPVSHTMSAIINAVSDSQMRIVRLKEFDYDIGITEVYDGKGFPLSYIPTAEKCR